MRAFLKIVGVILKDNYRLSKNENKAGKIAVYVALGVMYLFFEAFLVFVLNGLGQAFKELGLVPQLLTGVMVLGLSIVTMFGIMPMLSLLYFAKDGEFYLSLPISPSKVYFAKLATVYVSHLFITTIILLPALYTVGIAAKLSLAFYLVMIFALALLPVFSLTVVSIICLPLTFLIRFFKRKGMVASMIAIIFFLVIFVFYMLLVNNVIDMPESMDVIALLVAQVNIVSAIFPLLLAINRFATFTAYANLGLGVSMLLNFLIFVVPIVLVFFVALFISRIAYSRAVSAQLENVKRGCAVEAHQNKSSVIKALLAKEWKDIIRTPIFALQCFAGLIIAPVFLVLMSMSGQLQFAAVSPTYPYESWLSVTFFLQLLMSVNIGASTSISREAASVYILKLLPVRYQTIIKAKKLFYNIIYDVDITLCFVIAFFAVDFSWIAIFLWIYLIICNYAFTTLCILMDLSKPKLDWKSYREIVKNSRNSTLPALLCMATTAVIGWVEVLVIFKLIKVLPAFWTIFIAISILLALALAFLFVVRAVLKSNTTKYFQRIEA